MHTQAIYSAQTNNSCFDWTRFGQLGWLSNGDQWQRQQISQVRLVVPWWSFRKAVFRLERPFRLVSLLLFLKTFSSILTPKGKRLIKAVVRVWLPSPTWADQASNTQLTTEDTPTLTPLKKYQRQLEMSDSQLERAVFWQREAMLVPERNEALPTTVLYSRWIR